MPKFIKLRRSIEGQDTNGVKRSMNHLILSSSSSSSSSSSCSCTMAMAMANRGGLLFLKANFGNNKNTFGKAKTLFGSRLRNYSTPSALQPPDVPRLAETARISLTPNEVEEFGPKIQQVIDWFGQLQAVDLDSVEPAIRADTEGDNLRDDVPEIFENREAMIVAVPSYEEPYIKVPKVLNKE